MKVYVLLTWSGEEYVLDEIFETDEKAEAYAKEKGITDDYIVTERRVL